MDVIILRQLVEEKLSAKQIADKLGKSEAGVRLALKRNGIKTFRHIEQNRNDKTKICRYCNIEKTIVEFPIGSVVKDKTYYRNKCNKCYVAMKKERRNEIVSWISEVKKNLSCNHCGNADFRVIQFHHNMDDKSFNIADMSSQGFSKNSIAKEIEKCIPLCANCHAIIHYEERQVQILSP